MGALIDIKGKRYGRLVAIERTGRNNQGKVLWKCICDCGSDHIATSNNLRTGQTKSCGCGYRKGETHYEWKGESASYGAKHQWMHNYFGSADHCEINPSHRARRFEWSNISGRYLRERSDWRQLCPSCHRLVDKGNFCKRGHEFTSENTYNYKENSAENAVRALGMFKDATWNEGSKH
jgi:hypothetical protein